MLDTKIDFAQRTCISAALVLSANSMRFVRKINLTCGNLHPIRCSRADIINADIFFVLTVMY